MVISFRYKNALSSYSQRWKDKSDYLRPLEKLRTLISFTTEISLPNFPLKECNHIEISEYLGDIFKSSGFNLTLIH